MGQGRWTLRDAGLGLLATAASVCGAELALHVLGVQTAAPLELSRGFDEGEAYIQPDSEHPGHWRTAIGAPAIDGESIPPKGEAVRVLLMGGSNTRGFREQVLEEALEEQAGQDFEVLNLGRPGYGSGRVAILLDQALPVLEPDLVVLYSGHNEFVERSFRAELEAWGGGQARWLASLAQHLRCVRLLRDVASGRRPQRHDDPRAWVFEYGKYVGLPYSETQAELDAYGQNLSRMAAAVQKSGARVVLSTVVFNRFSQPRVSTLEGVSAEERASFEGLLRRARSAYPSQLAPLLPPEAMGRVSMGSWGRTRGYTTEPLPGLRPLTGPLEGQQPTFFTGDRSPLVPALYSSLAWLGAARTSAEEVQLQSAAADLDMALLVAPGHPQALFERALIGWALGQRRSLVRRCFEGAARFDRAPRKATPLSNDHVREVASSLPEALLVDLDEAFRETSEAGLVGWELMVDHCHLGPLAGEHAQRILADEIVRCWYPEEQR